MRRILYMLFLLLFGNSLIGQNKLTNAIDGLKSNELDRARALIDAAMEDTLFSDRSSTWYYRGAIYKEIFKQKENTDKQSLSREVALEAFKKSLELESEGVYVKSSKQSLNFLAQTIYNHSATSLDTRNYENAITLYKKYKEIIVFVEPETDFMDKGIMFNLALATVYGKIAEEDTSKQKEFFDKAKKLYEEVLSKDADNISANYNLGILYYNEGVEIVNTMDYSLDLFELNAVQDQIIELFRQSLPYMEKAYKLNPKRKETLIGLQGIYFSLNDIEKSEEYKRLLEELEGEDTDSEEPNEGEVEEVPPDGSKQAE